MARDSSAIFVPQDARVFVGALGSVAPTDADVAPAIAWADAGWFDPGSLRFSVNPDFGQTNSHGAAGPTRQFQTKEAQAFECDLQQFTAPALEIVFGGGTRTQITAPSVGPPAVLGQYRWDPPKMGTRKDMAAIMQVTDGSKQARLVMPRGACTEQVQTDFHNNAETQLPMRLSLVSPDIGSAYYWLADWAGFSLTAT